MQLSDWAQEDPTSGSAGTTDAPYPQLSPVTFTNLKENGESPRLTYKDATALASPNGLVAVPSNVESGRFTLDRGTPPQGRFLRGIGGLDSAFNRFDDPRIVGGGMSPANGQMLVAAINAFDSGISLQHRPPKTNADIRRLVRHNRALTKDLKTWAAARHTKAALVRFTSDAMLDYQFSNAVRSDLGLPPTGLDRR
jgi:hypothetical protein